MSHQSYLDYHFKGRTMPVPTWDCPELGLLDEPLDTATVVSEDIWKKFDLDFPQAYSSEQYYGSIEDGLLPDAYDKSASAAARLEAREIRHHDCMWAGLCISKEHNRTHPAKKDVQITKKIPAGRSLLINRKPPATTPKNLESDGDSTRPETPQSCESETDSEDEVPQFKHDSISINEKLSEYLGDARSASASEVTGQLVRRAQNVGAGIVYGQQQQQQRTRRNLDTPRDTPALSPKSVYDENTSCDGSAIVRGSTVSLGDHCYHLNQTSSSKKLEHLGVQTPSDSEEEIDVVTFDKPCRPASLPTNPSAADRQHLQKTVNSALTIKEKSPPRPRGRPPSNAPRKRSAQADSKPAKRPRHKTYQKRGKPSSRPTLERMETTTSSSRLDNRIDERIERVDRGSKSSSAMSRSSSDDEPDTEKRSLHNNMERQRRIELRNAFEELRVLVPEVEMKEKAPKVVILRQAAVYCDMLTEMGQATVSKVTELKRRQDRLRTRLSQLRRSFAAAR